MNVRSTIMTAILMLLVQILSEASHVHVTPVMKAPARLVPMLMSVQQTHTTVIPKHRVRTRLGVLRAYVTLDSMVTVSHVLISTNVRTMNTTAIQMLLVRTRLVASPAHATRVSQAAVLLAPITTSVS